MSQLIWKRRKWGEITAGNAGEDESGDDSRRIAAGNGRAEAAGGWLERAERTAVAAVEPVSAEPVSAEPAGIQAAWSWTGYEAADTGRNAAEPVPAPELTVQAGIDAGFSRLLPVAGRTDAEISSAETLHMAANVETPEDMAETAAFNPAFGKKAVLSEGAEETPEGEAAEVMVPAAAPEPAVPPAGSAGAASLEPQDHYVIGRNTSTAESIDISIPGGVQYRDFYGGGYNGDVHGGISLTFSSVTMSNLYAAGYNCTVDDGLTVNIEKDGHAVIAERLIGRSDSSFQNVTVNGTTVLNVGGTLSVGGVLSGFDSIQVQGNLSVGGELKGFDEIRVSGAVMEVGSLIFDGSGDSLNLAVSDPVAPGMELPADSEARRDAIQNIADNYAVLKLDRLDNSAGGTIIVTFDGSLADVEWVRIRVIDYTGSPDAAVDYGDFRFAGSHGVLAVSDNDLYLVVEGVREHVVVASNYATISDAMIAIKDMSYEAGIVEQPALISVETGRHVLEADDVIKNCRISGEGEEGAVLTAAGSLYLGSHWVTLDHLAVEFSGESNLYGGCLWENAAYSAAGHDIASDVVLDSVVFTNLQQIFGGGAVMGKSMADFTGDLALTVSGATSAGQVYAGFEVDTSRMVYHAGETVLTLNTTGSVTSVRGGVVRNGTLEVEGSSRIAILGAGSGKVSVIGDYVAYSSATGAATVKRTGDTSVTIDAPGSAFGTVSGAGASFGGYYQLVGNSAVEIRGGSFTGDIYGGAMATSFGYAAQTHILGNTSVSIDCGGSLVNIGDLNIYACSYGKGSVSGDATVTFSGDGNNLDFSGYVVGDSSAATTMISFVEGSSSLVFDRFTGNFNAVSIAGFDRIVISGSSVRWTAMERNLSDVTDWEFELGDPSRASLTADLFAGNDFSGDTIRLTFEEEAISGSGWTVIDAGDAGWFTNLADASVWFNGVEAEWKEGAWCAGGFRLSAGDDNDLRLTRQLA